MSDLYVEDKGTFGQKPERRIVDEESDPLLDLLETLGIEAASLGLEDPRSKPADVRPVRQAGPPSSTSPTDAVRTEVTELLSQISFKALRYRAQRASLVRLRAAKDRMLATYEQLSTADHPESASRMRRLFSLAAGDERDHALVPLVFLSDSRSRRPRKRVRGAIGH
jgi:hypothetical protein